MSTLTYRMPEEFQPTPEDLAYALQVDWEDETGVRRQASRKGPWFPVIRQQMLERDGHRCRLNSRHTENLEAHHRNYRERCSDETVDDLTTLCRPCHAIYEQFIKAVRNVEERA